MHTRFYRRISIAPAGAVAGILLAVTLLPAGSSLGICPSWTWEPSMMRNRAYAASAVLDGKLYAFGGFSGQWGNGYTVEVFDPVTNSWNWGTSMPLDLRNHAAAAVGGKIYVMGGLGSSSLVSAYDPATDLWSARAPLPTGRSNFTATTLNGKIYAIGGDGAAATKVEEYDPVTNTWATKAPVPTSRWYHTAVAVGGKIYVIGGQGTMQTVEAYDPVTNTWTSKADMPTGRFAFAAAALCGKIYAAGGYSAAGKTAFAEEYDPVADTWAPQANLPVPMYYHMGESMGGKIYFFGGSGSWPLGQYVLSAGAGVEASLSVLPKVPAESSRMDVYLQVKNEGCSAAQDMAVQIQFNEGGGIVSPWAASSGSVYISSGATHIFSFTYTVTGVGTLNMTCTLTGSFEGTGCQIMETRSVELSSSAALTVPADLRIASSPVVAGTTIPIVLNLENTTGTTVHLALPQLAVTEGMSLVEYVRGPIPGAGQILLAGMSQEYTWYYRIAHVGRAGFMSSVAGSCVSPVWPVAASATVSLSSIESRSRREFEIVVAPNVMDIGDGASNIAFAVSGTPGAQASVTVFSGMGKFMGRAVATIGADGTVSIPYTNDGIDGRRPGIGAHWVLAESEGKKQKKAFFVMLSGGRGR